MFFKILIIYFIKMLKFYLFYKILILKYVCIDFDYVENSLVWMTCYNIDGCLYWIKYILDGGL